MPNHAFPYSSGSRRLLMLLPAIFMMLAAAKLNASPLRFTPVVRAVEGVSPSVVNLHGRKTVRSQDPYGTTDSLRQVNGMGTGVVIDERGYLITNYHVIEGVRRIEVTLGDKRSTTARLVAHDPETDLAIIKIDVDQGLPVIKIGTSSDLRVAEPVIAVGNAYGYEHTVTEGIVSALHRTVQVSDEQTYDDLIQTSAAINPGNSGGPLLNIDGEMIGLNVAVRVGAQGIGFAIPADEVMDVAAKLMAAERRRVVAHGVAGKTIFENNIPRFVVRSIGESSGAKKAGLRLGDVITSVDDQMIERALDFERALLERQPGDEVTLTVRRSGAVTALNLVLDDVAGSAAAPQERFWRTLGLRLEAVPQHTVRRTSTRYRGGLKVTSVRTGGPAESRGIRRGDILVGMHQWETISLENVSYILNRPDFEDFQPIKFYVLRGSETLFGHMRVSGNTRP